MSELLDQYRLPQNKEMLELKKFNRKNNFLMFCDDDILFHKNSFKNMDKFINKYPKYVGYGFNLIERENKFFENIKKSKIFKYFGFL